MSFGINAVSNFSSPIKMVQKHSSVAGKDSEISVPVPDAATTAMMSRMSDGFDAAPATKSGVKSTGSGIQKPKKSGGGGLLGKIGGILGKVLPIVKNLAQFIPGLGAMMKPLEMASSFLGK